MAQFINTFASLFPLLQSVYKVRSWHLSLSRNFYGSLLTLNFATTMNYKFYFFLRFLPTGSHFALLWENNFPRRKWLIIESWKNEIMWNWTNSILKTKIHFYFVRACSFWTIDRPWKCLRRILTHDLKPNVSEKTVSWISVF